MNNRMVLLRALLRSTSQWNIYRLCKDKKKKGRIIGNTIGYSILYLALIAYCVGTCIGYGQIGLTEVIPALCAFTISLMAFLFTILKTNGYLFGFKEYDMLMSLPFKTGDVAGCKFLYMYIKSLPWNLSISVAMMIGYAVYADTSFLSCVIWMILSFFLPLIPMLAAAFIGFVFARISAGFKKKNIIQTVLTFGLILLCFSLRFIVEDLAKSGKISEALAGISESVKELEGIYLPAGWFERAVTELSLPDILLLSLLSIVLFELVFFFVGRSYRQINSALRSHAARRDFKMNEQKSRSILNAIAFKEWKRMTGSTLYMTNMGFGELFALIAGVAVFFVDIDSVIATVTKNAPVTKEMLYPAIPLIVYLFIGMVATTAATPSLEGKNYWIMQSLPVTRKQLWQGKMLYNMYLTVPCSLFATIAICISARTPILTMVLCVLLGICLCGFSSAWGCVCGIKHMRLDWENEIEVIKQGAAVALYMFPNMLATIALMVLAVFLGTKIHRDIILAALILIVSGLAALCYRKAVRL